MREDRPLEAATEAVREKTIVFVYGAGVPSGRRFAGEAYQNFCYKVQVSLSVVRGTQKMYGTRSLVAKIRSKNTSSS